jgi:hypothetical protein
LKQYKIPTTAITQWPIFNPQITQKEKWHRAMNYQENRAKPNTENRENSEASREVFHKPFDKRISLSLFTASRETLQIDRETIGTE